MITKLRARVIYLEGLTVVTAIDHTIDNIVTGNQNIICTDDLTVFLTVEPNDRDLVTVKVGQKNTRVVIDGNGRNIENQTSLTLRRISNNRQIGMKMRYSSELDAWYTE